MTSTEVLTAAVNKAIANGWDGNTRRWFKVGISWFELDNDGAPAIEEIIFDHGFAKALWGDDVRDMRCSHCRGNGFEYCSVCKDDVAGELPTYKHHLQRMVIADDPIEYLRSTLGEG